MNTFKEIGSSDLNLPKDSYIYNIIPINPQQLACISSDDSIRLFNTQTLQPIPDGIIENAHKGITSIKSFSLPQPGTPNEILLTSGRDGLVKTWDFRTKSKLVMEYSTPKAQPLSMVAGNASLHAIVAGVELEKDGPGDVSVFGWDARNPTKHTLEYSESHTDTVTELRFLPSPNGEASPYLLSASTDGLVNVFNTSITDEDDAVFQVINHKSAVHHAGLLGRDIYAMGTDETITFYSQQDGGEEVTEPPPVHLGDVRGSLGCDYVVKIAGSGARNYIACGKTGEEAREQYLDLVPLREPQGEVRLSWAPDVGGRIRLQGGHGTEVIRDVYVEEGTNRVFTCGEDGMVRCWQGSAAIDVDMEGGKSKKRRKDQDGTRKEKKTKKV